MAEYARLFMELKDAAKSLVKGEVEARGFVGQIELDDWSWDLGRDKGKEKPAGDGSAATGSGATLGKLVPSVLKFGKRMDRSSPVMLSMMESGKLASATITLEEASDADFEMTITLEDIRIIEYELEGEVSDKSGELKEKWVFNYKTIKFTYLPSKGENPGARGLREAEFTRNPNDPTDKPGGDKDTETFKQLATKFGEKTARSLFDSIDWKQPAKKPESFKNDEPDVK